MTEEGWKAFSELMDLLKHKFDDQEKKN